MEQRRATTQRAGEWFMSASEGDMELRVRPGMSLGEKEAGDLTFDSAWAQLTLNITPDGSLVIATLDDFELESRDSKRHSRVSLARNRRAEIHLPHHVMRLETAIADLLQPNHDLAVLTVRSKPQVAAAQIGPFRSEEEPGEPVVDRPHSGQERPSFEPETESAVTPPEGRRHRTDEPIRAFDSADRKPERQRTSAPREQEQQKPRRRPLLTLVTGVLSGLALIGLALSYPLLRDLYTELVPAGGIVRMPPFVADPEAAAATTETRLPSIEPEPSTIRLPPGSAQILDLQDPSIQETSPRAALVQGPTERSPAAGSVSEPVVTPVAPPDMVQPAVRPAIPTAATAVGSAAPESQAETVTRQVDPLVVAELEDSAANAWAYASERARQMDLVNADLALTQGRLTGPAEASAYTLYSRVLAQDPASTEARRGLQAVRQALINRTLAQLASNRLRAAQKSLNDAEDVGVDPRVIADLRGEIALRQQRTDAWN